MKHNSIIGKASRSGLRAGMAAVAVALVWCTAMLSSCSTNTGSMIPNDSYYVASVNVANVWSKADMDNVDNVAFIKLLRQELKGENAGLSEMLDKLLKEPGSCGLNIKSDLIAFTSPSIGKETVVICANMKDASDFGYFLKDLGEKANMQIVITKESGYYFAKIDNKTSVCWDKKKAYLLIGENGKEQRDGLMTLKKEASMEGNADFDVFWKERGDAGFFIVNGNISEIIPNADRLPLDKESQKNVSYCCSLNFEKGAIRASCKAIGQDAEELGNLVGDKFDSDLMRYMPQKALAALSLTFNIDGLINMLAKMKGVDLNDEIGMGDYTMKDVIGSFGGSIVAAVSDFNSKGLPVFAVAADLTQKSIMKELLGEIVDDGLMTKKTDYYYISLLDISIVLDNNSMLVTNDPTLRSVAGNGGGNATLINVDNNIKKGNYFYLDLNTDNYPQSLTGRMDKTALSMLNGYWDRLEVSPKGKDACEMVIYLKSADENSLAYTIHYIDNNLVQLGNLAEGIF